MTKQDILNKIFDHNRDLNMVLDNKGYVNSNEENLIKPFANWDEIKKELNDGQGNELKHKFNATHSSSALAVNNFAPFKEHYKDFSFLNYSEFIEASFEKKLPTGISIPNLDFYLETKFEIVGIESKFTEHLSKKLPNHDKNLNKYLNHPKLDYLSKDFHNDLIEHYANENDKMYLDVAQLIKHGIGIIKKAQTKYKFILNAMITQPILVYIYWQPNNWYNHDIFRKHADEIEIFKKKIQPFLTFIPLSYLDFWKSYENDRIFGNHIKDVKERYLFKI